MELMKSMGKLKSKAGEKDIEKMWNQHQKMKEEKR
jgi:hypothetical protein